MTYIENDCELGEIVVRDRKGSSRFTARWKNGHVEVITPVGVSYNETIRAIDAMRQRLLARRPSAMFEIGRPLCLDGGITYHFQASSLHPGQILLQPTSTGGIVTVASDLTVGSVTVDSAISRMLIKSAHLLAPIHILPRAKQIASELGLRVEGWRISNGKRTLGTCSSRRVITLSSLLIFLPQALRDYIVCHELAHLTEMNHSPRFHDLCDQYCSGKEAVLIKELKNYTWPILK